VNAVVEGRCIFQETGDLRESTFLCQRLSMTVQRFTAVAILDTLTLLRCLAISGDLSCDLPVVELLCVAEITKYYSYTNVIFDNEIVAQFYF